MAGTQPIYKLGIGWRRDTDATRHHRENLWDYTGRGIYHITLATEGRYPLLGTLKGENMETAYIDYTPLGEMVSRTFLGLPAFYAPKGIHLRVLALRIMPDHIHGVLHVLEPMPISIGEVVRSFKSTCSSWFKRTYYLPLMERERVGGSAPVAPATPSAGSAPAAPAPAKMPEECTGGGSVHITAGISPASPTTQGSPATPSIDPMATPVLVHFCRILAATAAAAERAAAAESRVGGASRRSQSPRCSIWEYMPAGYHERILHCEGQLDSMIRYVKDNPRRLWLRRHNPDLFRIHNDWRWSFEDEQGVRHNWRFRVLGNMFLMDWPQRQHIQCSRSISQEQLREQQREWFRRAKNGTVSITSAISEGEKLTARLLREQGMPLVVMLKDGFPPPGSPHERYFKPGGVYFDACATGRLLLIEPYPEVLRDPLVRESVYRKSPSAPPTSMRYHFLALNTIGRTLALIHH